MEKLFARYEEINDKVNTLIMNVGRLSRFLLPNENKLQKPANLPTVPVKTQHELTILETFLENDCNLANAVSNQIFYINLFIFFYFLSL